MKKIKITLSVLLSLIITLSFAGMTAGAESSVLTQNTVIRPGNTYYINTFDDLKTLSILINERSQDCTGAIFELTSDITLNRGAFGVENGTPVYNGNEISPENAPALYRSAESFSGTLDGKGHKISGIYSKGCGLFEEINNAVIKDLFITNSLFVSHNENTGAFCGTAVDSVLSGCRFSGFVASSEMSAGGIVGAALGGELRYCKNDGVISGSTYVGGIAGIIYDDVTLFGLCNAGEISASGNYAGGLAGSLSIGESSSMKYCYNTGAVIADSFAGGFSGHMYIDGDNHEYEIGKLEEMQVWINIWRNSLGDNYIIDVWPYPGLENYIDIDEYERLRSEINKVNRNVVNCYSSGAVSSVQNKKSGSVCGEFAGCAWNFNNCWVNNGSFDPQNRIYRLTLNSLGYGPVCGINFILDEKMKEDSFINTISTSDVVFTADTLNENHGYPVLLDLHDSSVHEHYFVPQITQEPTCTQKGVCTYICECGAYYKEPIDAAGHDFVYVSHDDATCTRAAYDVYRCRVCHDILNKKVEGSSALGHDYDEVVIKEKTCTSYGLIRKTCRICGDVTDEVIRAGHVFVTVSEKHATCTEDGYKNEVCTVCGYENNQQYKAHHIYNTLLDSKAPTCTEDGYDSFHCIMCNKDITEVQPAKGHQWVNNSPGTSYFILNRKCSVCKLSDYGAERFILYGGQNHYRSGSTVYYPYKNITDFSQYNIISSPVSIVFELQYDNTALEFEKITLSSKLRKAGASLEKISCGNDTVDFTLVLPDAQCIDLDDVVFDIKYNVLSENFIKPSGAVNIITELNGNVFTGSGVNEDLFGWIYAEYTNGEPSGNKTYDDLTREYSNYVPEENKLSSVEYVTYTQSYYAENDYVLKVNRIAEKVQFITPSGSTATYTRSSAKSIVSYDINGGEVPAYSKDTAYEIWTVHCYLRTGCDMQAHIKANGKWESDTKHFTVELKKKDVTSIQSVTWQGKAVSRNDYFIKVKGQPSKIAFYNPNNSTATYTRSLADIKCYDADNNEVSPGSKNISYEIWTINRSMKTNAEMRVRAKFGSVWETEMFTFTVK